MSEENQNPESTDSQGESVEKAQPTKRTSSRNKRGNRKSNPAPAPKTEDKPVEQPEASAEKKVETEAEAPEVNAEAPEVPETPVTDPEAPKEEVAKDLDISVVGGTIISQVRDYAEVMNKGRPMDATRGASQQLLLHRAIQRIFNLEGKEFYTVFKEVLAIINENRDGAFHEKRLYRFIDQVKMSTADRKCFERLLNLFITVCDPAQRQQALKQVDIESVAGTLRNGEKEQKLISFFGG